MINMAMPKIQFTYVDEFGQEMTMIKTYDECIFNDQSTFELLVGKFKQFLKTAFAESLINTIQIVENETEE
jgi:hypothetical protein